MYNITRITCSRGMKLFQLRNAKLMLRAYSNSNVKTWDTDYLATWT